MLSEVRGSDRDDLFVLPHRKRVIALLIDALGARPDTLSHGLARGLKGLVRPALDRNRHRGGLVTFGWTGEDVTRDRLQIRPEWRLLLMTRLLIVCPAGAMYVGVRGYSWHKFNSGSIGQTTSRLALASLLRGK
jgi:hypothetical protein